MFSQRIMDQCITHALKNPIRPRGRTSISRMAALITDGDQEIFGRNKYKTHPLMYKFSKDHSKICLHAELDACISFLHRDMYNIGFSQFDIYVSRVLKNDSVALARPCDTCFGALSYFGIQNIYWTTNRPGVIGKIER